MVVQKLFEGQFELLYLEKVLVKSVCFLVFVELIAAFSHAFLKIFDDITFGFLVISSMSLHNCEIATGNFFRATNMILNNVEWVRFYIETNTLL